MKDNSNNEALKEHIEKNVFPEYSKNDEGHNLEHIKYVLGRCERLSKDMKLDKNILYTAAAYHDIGCHIDRETHEIISAQMMMDDTVLREFFNEEELNIIKEAIEDHRASSENEPRTIYGKILSSADRNNSIDLTLHRMYFMSKKLYPENSEDEQIERMYKRFTKKYGSSDGSDGYAKSWVDDPEFDKLKKDSKELSQDKAKFVKMVKKVISEIEGQKNEK